MNSYLLRGHVKTFIKLNIVSIVLPFLFIVILSIMGLTPGVSNAFGSFKGNALGFSHPNGTGDIVISILISIFLLLGYLIKTHKINFHIYLINIIGTLIISLIFYEITKCREIMYFEIIMFMLSIFNNFDISRKIWYELTLPLTIITPILFVYFGYAFNLQNNFYMRFNTILSSRLEFQNELLQFHPVKFLQYFKDIPHSNGLTGNSLVIDSTPITILENCGYIGLIITMVIILICVLHAMNFKEYNIYSLIFTIVTCSCFDSSLLTILFEAPFICAYINLYNRKSIKQVIKD